MNDGLSKEELALQVEELKAQIHGLEKDLIHDSLTGLKTRAFFEEEVNVYLESISNAAEAKRKEWFGFKHISFLFLDIDHFKAVNDTYGHAIGDMVLKKVVETIQKALREGDTAARWGGEEIVVSLLGANEEDAFHTSLRIIEFVKALRFPEAPELKVTISCGIATAREGVSLQELIACADKALYQAKEMGRDTVVRYSQLSS